MHSGKTVKALCLLPLKCYQEGIPKVSPNKNDERRRFPMRKMKYLLSVLIIKG
jgi:hypothetical protein